MTTSTAAFGRRTYGRAPRCRCHRPGTLALESAAKNPYSAANHRPTDDPGFVVRAQHAHMNCVENLPVFAAIVLSAYALGRPGVADGVASYVLGARLAQSSVHLIGVNHWLVFVRGTLFTIQVVLFLYMIRELLA